MNVSILSFAYLALLLLNWYRFTGVNQRKFFCEVESKLH